jgi:hypothetical protein
VVEFDHFKTQAGLPSFVLSPTQWVEKTGAIGIFSKSGRYGGTYAHKDIAFEFGSAISAEFKLYLIKEFQRLKEDENNRLKLEWNLQRTLAKVNYHFNFFLSLAGGRKLSCVITFFPVFCSNANLASFAILPPFLPAMAFCFTPFAFSVSAI